MRRGVASLRCEGKHEGRGVVAIRDTALSRTKEPLVGTATHAAGQPDACQALIVGDRSRGVEETREPVGLRCRGERIGGVPVAGVTKRELGRINRLPAFVKTTLLVDANAAQRMRPAVTPACRTKVFGGFRRGVQFERMAGSQGTSPSSSLL